MKTLFDPVFVIKTISCPKENDDMQVTNINPANYLGNVKLVFLFLALIFLVCPLSMAQWQGFQAPSRYHTDRTSYILTKDINNDTYPDIITVDVFTTNANSFGISLNDGTGHFQPETLIPIRAGYTVWDFADLNNDGLTDILTSYYWDNGIRVYNGSALLSFTEGPLMPTATHGGMSTIYDVDGDGKPDLVSISQGSGNPTRLHIFKGNGDGTFLPKVTYESPYTTARNLTITDINQDGLPDIVLAASYNKIPVFIQNQDHSFTSKEISVEHGEGVDNAVGDINNDDIPDIVYGSGDFVTAGKTDTIRVILGKGQGLFKPPYTTPGLSSITNPLYVRLADLNKDNYLDIITFDYLTNNLYYFLGNGDSTFAPPVKITTNDTIKNFEVNDLNQDGYPDIVTVNKDSVVSILLNKGESTNVETDPFSSMVSIYPNPFNESLTIELSLPATAFIKVDIVDMSGRKVDELANEKMTNETRLLHWNANTPTGIYFLRVSINEEQRIYKLIRY